MQTLFAHIGPFHIHPQEVAALAVLALVSIIIFVAMEVTAKK